MMRRIALLLCSLLLLPAAALAQAANPVKLRVGMVAAVDMLALPIAVERGFFEKYGLDVTIARPYATGVDALNALHSVTYEIDEAHGTPYHERFQAFLTQMQAHNFVIGGAMTVG